MATRTLGEDVHALFALDDELLQDPYPLYARLREQAPAHFADASTVLISSHAEAKASSRNNETFKSSPHRGGQRADRFSLLSTHEVELMQEIQAVEGTFMAHK